jgi:hypothetical protein
MLEAGISDSFSASDLSTETVKDRDNTPLLYIMNYRSGGFVVVSATRNFYPVLAYSEDNSLELTPENTSLWFWFEMTKDIIRESDSLDESVKEEIRSLWHGFESGRNQIPEISLRRGYPDEYSAYIARLSQLVSTYGSQGWVFSALPASVSSLGSSTWNTLNNLAAMGPASTNYSIVGIKNPTLTNYNIGPFINTKWDQYWMPSSTACYAGCATVAMAQIMKYHGKPTGYIWSNMYDLTETASTKTLFFNIGTSLPDVNYNNCSVGTTISNVTNSFINTFGYSNTTYSSHSVASAKNFLIQNKPIYMRGDTGSSPGHAWVCAGFREYEYPVQYFVEFLTNWAGDWSYGYWDHGSSSNPKVASTSYVHYFYMNWGYGGSGDAWFLDYDMNAPTGNFNYNRSNAYPN